jgi:peptide deformylase
MQIISSSDPLLHTPSRQFIEDELKDAEVSLKPIAKELISILYQQNALGVSACQVGIDAAMFVMDVNNNIRVCSNPTILAASLDMSLGTEGCLSYPGLKLNVRRPESIAVQYYDLDGNEVREHLEGIEARVWLHEYDHTMGICFTDRVSKLSLNMAKKKLAKVIKKRNNT